MTIPASDPRRNTLIRVCEGLLNYAKASKTKIAGYSYQTDRLFNSASARSELYKKLQLGYFKLAGCECPFSEEEMFDTFTGTRKGNYKALRDGKPIYNEKPRPLFDLPEIGIVSTVYVYWGHNARADRKLIKIGYTAQDLAVYLRTKVIAHNPILLATKCGSEDDEKCEHMRFKMYIADGREWFFPRPALLDALERDYDTTEDFTRLRKEIEE